MCAAIAAPMAPVNFEAAGVPCREAGRIPTLLPRFLLPVTICCTGWFSRSRIRECEWPAPVRRRTHLAIRIPIKENADGPLPHSIRHPFPPVHAGSCLVDCRAT
jgi:hypothetical protein